MKMEMEISGHQMSSCVYINNTAIKLTSAYLLSKKTLANMDNYG
jgi:hypothetical protein